jgi:hypothetical protein
MQDSMRIDIGGMRDLTDHVGGAPTGEPRDPTSGERRPVEDVDETFVSASLDAP